MIDNRRTKENQETVMVLAGSKKDKTIRGRVDFIGQMSCMYMQNALVELLNEQLEIGS